MTKRNAKYSEAMVAAIKAASEMHGTLNSGHAIEILQDPAFEGSEITARGVIAKIRSMQLPYAKVERLTKAGEPVMTKDEMAEAICLALGLGVLKSLAKAEKGDLRALLERVAVEPQVEAVA